MLQFVPILGSSSFLSRNRVTNSIVSSMHCKHPAVSTLLEFVSDEEDFVSCFPYHSQDSYFGVSI